MGMKRMQRWLSLVMVPAIALSAAACSNNDNEAKESSTAAPTATGGSATATATAGITFPLAEPVTFTIAGVNGTESENPEQTDFLKKMAEKTNVHIKYISLGSDASGATEKLNVLLGTADAPDAIMGASAMNETFFGLVREGRVFGSDESVPEGSEGDAGIQQQNPWRKSGYADGNYIA
ncbi:hypothetical protein [Cohnella rhizosphaerae]|uniref:Extracellular solute-binding protein n=1 Tax=Cohnella rhizosphaerae TaxID=1457232 RepID=A0A9X4KT10_9BACL|nr:hypothetical protein [Cohnella rhizosphaerae]MDG0808209.1 hypothetical protein [Cohnella rhizosphaerae]